MGSVRAGAPRRRRRSRLLRSGVELESHNDVLVRWLSAFLPLEASGWLVIKVWKHEPIQETAQRVKFALLRPNLGGQTRDTT